MKPLWVVGAIWVLALVLGALAVGLLPRPAAGEGGILAGLLGESRIAVSRSLFASADRYYHGGVEGLSDANVLQQNRDTGVGEMAHSNEETPPAPERARPDGLVAVVEAGPAPGDGDEPGHEDNDACGHAHDEHGQGEAGQAGAVRDPWRWLLLHVRPTEHRHLSGASLEKEILPWLWAAVRTDPHNVLAYDVGAYWLAKRLRRPDKALDLLAEGIRFNPDSPQLEYSRGAVLQEGGRMDDAFAAFRGAEAKWNRLIAAGEVAVRQQEKTESDDMDEDFHARILLSLGYNCQLRGRYADARLYYEKALPHAKSPTGVRGRLAELERLEAAGSGKGPAVP